MIYQIIAKPVVDDVENVEECLECAFPAQTYIDDFNEKKGYNFLNEERFSTEITDTKFRYMSIDEVVQLKIDISNFNSTIGKNVIELVNLI